MKRWKSDAEYEPGRVRRPEIQMTRYLRYSERLSSVDMGAHEIADYLSLGSVYPRLTPLTEPMTCQEIDSVKSDLDWKCLSGPQPIPKVSRKDQLSSLFALRPEIKESEKAFRNGTQVRHEFVGTLKHFSQTKLANLHQIEFLAMQAFYVHAGRFLLCRVVSPPVRATTNVSFGVEDPAGLILKVSLSRIPIFNGASNAALDILLPIGTPLAVREPVVEVADGPPPCAFVSVTSPSDLIFLAPSDSILQNIVWNHTIRLPRPISSRVDQLNLIAANYLKAGQYQTAVRIFTKCLALNPNDPSLRVDRARAYVELEHFEAALVDASAAFVSTNITPGQKPEALYQVAKSELGLRRYPSALEKLLSLDLTLVHVKQAVKRCRERMGESRVGHYNWAQMFTLAAKSMPVDAAEFTGPIKVASSSRGGGRGIVATRKIRVGELLLVSTPIVSAFPGDSSIFDRELGANFIRKQVDGPCRVALISKLISKVVASPELYSCVTALYAGPTYPPPPSQLPPATRSPYPHAEIDIDTTLLEHIITYNAFYLKNIVHPRSTCSDTRNFLELPSALYLLPSLFNHSCVPNTTWHHFGDVMVIRAAKNIVEGEELTLSYISGPGDTLWSRAAELELHTSRCDCSLCGADRNDEEQQCRIRAAYDLLLRRSDIEEAISPEDLLANVETTYSALRGSFRPTMSRGYSYLMQVLARNAEEDPAQWSAVVAGGIQSLEAAGVVVKDKIVVFEHTGVCDESNDSLVIGTDAIPTFAPEMCVEVMLRMTRAFQSQGDMRMARRWLSAARWMEKASTGADRDMFHLRYVESLQRLGLDEFSRSTV
ncbi:hypothetical protein BOTBODRAFT_174977 [Botryobasidium botryosum FD-172 SS1]|uniref:SET domain-containing protein n=1 Tax=Botryobasidium botryosum (strain FD-172 SS1) TaxID=930990 RepID=A0A067MQM8_BOTB1|nr:hypothetical protein BOTBODRAFT_174977 [Botryobasidium botryosum FD-172 SS1]